MTASLRRLNAEYTLLNVIYWAIFAVFVGFQASLLLERGFTNGQIGIFGACRCFAGILSQPLLGGWADRHPEVPLKRVLCTCLLVSFAVSTAFYLTRPGFWGTALILLILGALELNLYPLLDSMAVQFISAGQPVNYSLSRGLGSLAYAVACVLMGRQSAALGVESILVTHGLLLLVMILAVARFPTLPQAPLLEGEIRPHSVRYLLGANPPFTWMLAAVFFAMVAVIPIANFMVSIVSDHGGGQTELGLALFLMGAFELPAAPLFLWLRRRIGAQRSLMLSVLFMGVKPLVFLLAPDLLWLMLVQPIQALGYGLFTPSSVYYTDESVDPVDRVRGQTVMMMASNGLGGMCGNLLAGYAIGVGGSRAMLAMCLLFGILGILCGLRSLCLTRRSPAVRSEK